MTETFTPSRTSPLSRLDVRLKMAVGFSMSLLVVLADSLPFLGGLVGAGLILFLASYPTRPQRRLTLASCALLVWGMMLSQGLFYNRFPRYALLVLLEPNWLLPDGLKLYAQGLHYGAVQSLRILAVSLTGYAICFSTEPDRFLRGLLSIRIPFSLSFMAVTAVRFIPVVAQEFQTVRMAMRLKGYRPLGRGLRDTILAEVSSLRPVLAGAIRRSQEVALSILTRGFTFDGKRTTLDEEPWTAVHTWSLASLALLVTTIATCKILFWLYQQELYYASSLRSVYAFARNWL
jgi:energy-coupling factor transport system permease protein